MPIVADRQAHSPLMVGEDVLDLRAHHRLAAVRAAGSQRHWAATWALAMDAADHAVVAGLVRVAAPGKCFGESGGARPVRAPPTIATSKLARGAQQLEIRCVPAREPTGVRPRRASEPRLTGSRDALHRPNEPLNQSRCSATAERPATPATCASLPAHLALRPEARLRKNCGSLAISAAC